VPSPPRTEAGLRFSGRRLCTLLLRPGFSPVTGLAGGLCVGPAPPVRSGLKGLRFPAIDARRIPEGLVPLRSPPGLLPHARSLQHLRLPRRGCSCLCGKPGVNTPAMRDCPARRRPKSRTSLVDRPRPPAYRRPDDFPFQKETLSHDRPCANPLHLPRLLQEAGPRGRGLVAAGAAQRSDADVHQCRHGAVQERLHRR
jgi:hypothetical protein